MQRTSCRTYPFVLPFLDVLAHLAPERQFALDGIRDVRRRADTVGKEVEIELFAPAFQEQRPRNLDTQSVSIAGYLLLTALLADTDLDRFVPTVLALEHDAERKGQECFSSLVVRIEASRPMVPHAVILHLIILFCLLVIHSPPDKAGCLEVEQVESVS